MEGYGRQQQTKNCTQQSSNPQIHSSKVANKEVERPAVLRICIEPLSTLKSLSCALWPNRILCYKAKKALLADAKFCDQQFCVFPSHQISPLEAQNLWTLLGNIKPLQTFQTWRPAAPLKLVAPEPLKLRPLENRNPRTMEPCNPETLGPSSYECFSLCYLGIPQLVTQPFFGTGRSRFLGTYEKKMPSQTLPIQH